MFPWEGKDIADVEALIAERDPYRYRIGALTVSATGARPPAMAWFSGRSEMGHYLARVEPRRHGLKGPALIQAREALQQALAGLEVRGLNKDTRAAVNDAAREAFHLAWWGSLEHLCQGGDEVAASLLAELDPPAESPLPTRRIPELVRFLHANLPVRAPEHGDAGPEQG